jgi:hypothetical protein
MTSKVLNSVVELNKINYDSTNNRINFSTGVSSNNIPVGESAGQYANLAYAHANAAFVSANNVAPQVQPAFDKANSAFTKANAAFDKANSAVSRQSFLANTGQTLFITNGYNIGYVDVFVNGIKLYSAEDFTATDGANVSISQPTLTQNDVVEIINWGGTAEPIARVDQYARDYVNNAWSAANSAYNFANSVYSLANNASNSANNAANSAASAIPITGSANISGNLIPISTNTYYLGSATNRWHSLYVGPGSIDLGGLILSNTNGALSVSTPGAPATPIAGEDTWVRAQANAAFAAANSVNVYGANTNNTSYFALPVGTTAQRPASPANGAIRLNTTTNNIEIYAGQWMNLYYTGTIIATGGTIMYNGNYKIHIFTGSGTFTVTQASPGANVELLVVGGGGGSTGYAGGAGGGGVIYEAQCPVTTASYPISVGAGGTGTIDNGNSYGGVGSGSNAFSQVVLGGGGSRGADATGPSPTCANGGGGGSRTAGYSGTAPVPVRLGVAYGGRTGGNGTEQPAYPGGGGAGAANNGSNQTGGTQGGPGGNGVLVDILGPSYYWAGGGGAMVYYAAQGNGGNGGLGGGGGGYDGGVGGAGYNPGGNAVASGVTGNRGGEGGVNTGGGAGGSGGEGGPANPMPNGGSGIVIIRYKYQ